MQNSAAVADIATTDSFLIVEDSLFDQQRITRTLKRNFGNADLHYASTLDAARAILQKSPISIILLDNNLPDGRGANFVLELAEDDALAEIPVIIISDWPSPFMWHKAKAAGVQFVLKKDEFHAGYVQFSLKRPCRTGDVMPPNFNALKPKLSAPDPGH